MKELNVWRERVLHDSIIFLGTQLQIRFCTFPQKSTTPSLKKYFTSVLPCTTPELVRIDPLLKLARPANYYSFVREVESMDFLSFILQHNENGKHSQCHSLNRLFVSLEKLWDKNIPSSMAKNLNIIKEKKRNQIKSKFIGDFKNWGYMFWGPHRLIPLPCVFAVFFLAVSMNN